MRPLTLEVVTGQEGISLNVFEFFNLLGDEAILDERIQGDVRFLLELSLGRRLCTQNRHHHFLPLLVEHILELLHPGVIQVALLLP